MQITPSFIMLKIFLCVTMEKMANKYKEMVLGDFVSMGGLYSWHNLGTEMNIRCLIVTY